MIFHQVDNAPVQKNPPQMLFLGPALTGWWALAALSAKFQANITLVTWDGFGEGAQTPFTSIAAEAEAIRTFVAKKVAGKKFTVIVGVGMGGQVALEMIAQDPALAKALVLGDVMCTHATGAKLTGKIDALFWRLKRKSYVRSQMEQIGIPPVLFSYYYQDFCETTPQQAQAQINAVQAFEIPQEITGIELPILITVGSLCPMPYHESAQKIARACPQSLINVIERGQRNELYLRQPERAQELICQFLSKNNIDVQPRGGKDANHH